jgi:hypothetical protein
MRLKKILAGLFLLGCCFDAFSQSSACEETLTQAIENFNAGHFYEIPAMLKPCLDKSDFTNEQRVRAYLLLCQTYLITDDLTAAEDSYLRLLRADPEYIATKEKDPIDVVYLSTKFTSTPIFTPHLTIGANASFTRTIYDNAIGDQTAPPKHVPKPGFLVGGGMDWNITDNISLCADVLLAYQPFKIMYYYQSFKTSMLEKDYWIHIPVYLKYIVSKGQIRPFGYAGVAADVMMGSRESLELDKYIGNQTAITTGKDVNSTYHRHILNRSLVFGGGMRYKIGKDYLFADIRYMAGLSNIVKSNIYSPGPKTPANPRENAIGFEVANYAHGDPFFRLDNLSISFGYVKPLYYPRKIKRARTKGLFRKIRKEENGVK